VDDVLVATVMINLGLKIALRDAGISIRETAVGDRYVLESMREGGFNLGGEQSGHVIFSDYATTGDGVLTGLQLAAQVAMTGKPLKELATVMTKLPQVLINVKGVDRSRVNKSSALSQAVTVAEAELGETGRVLLRPSGTEPVVRVMVEAGDEATAESIAERLAQVVRTELALELVTD
jgi:phosphoglucosamine mutase